VKNISTYSSTETILVNLDSHGTAVEDCTNTTTFAISKTISSEARARMYALLLAAKSSNSSVTIAFNDVGNCEPWDANQNAYRIITRING